MAGMRAEDALALAKAYVRKSLEGAGALKGQDGKSAYEIAVDNGYEGSEKEWIDYVMSQDITTTTSPTMQNSYPGRVLINEIGGGETRQGSTTGAQLFDVSKLKGTTVSADEDDWISVSYDNTEGTSDYYISVNVPASDLLTVNTEYVVVGEIESINGVSLELVSKVIGSNIGQFSTSVITSVSGTKVANVTTRESFDDCNTMLRTMCTFPAGSSGSAKFRISVLADTTVTADTFVYEKFTGGISSPNPEYPQEIEATVVSEIKTVGGQLFNKDNPNGVQQIFIKTSDNTFGKITGAAITRLVYIEIEPNTTYTAKKETSTIMRLATSVDIPAYGVAITNFVAMDTASAEPLTITAGSEDKYLAIQLSANGDELDNLELNMESLMLNRGAEALPWQSYTETVQQLTNPITLYNSGGVKDTFNPKQKNKMFGIVVFDGSIDEGWAISSASDTRYVTNKFTSAAKANGNVKCTHAKTVKSGTTVNTCFVNSSKYFCINTDIATLEEWLTHLASNPMTVVYELAEEEIEPLPTADQIALNSLPTYSTVTHLSTDTEIEPTYNLEYGTSKEGGYILEGLLAGRNGELTEQSNAERLTALEAAVVSNI